jgi:hypothetical protein
MYLLTTAWSVYLAILDKFVTIRVWQDDQIFVIFISNLVWNETKQTTLIIYPLNIDRNWLKIDPPLIPYPLERIGSLFEYLIFRLATK